MSERPVFEIVQRIEPKRGPIPILRRESHGLGVEIYRGDPCVSLEHAVALGVAAFMGQFEKAKPKPAAEQVKESRGRGLPERSE